MSVFGVIVLKFNLASKCSNLPWSIHMYIVVLLCVCLHIIYTNLMVIPTTTTTAAILGISFANIILYQQQFYSLCYLIKKPCDGFAVFHSLSISLSLPLSIYLYNLYWNLSMFIYLFIYIFNSISLIICIL